MYLDHYGFDCEPFNITPDSRFLFASTRHREAMAALLYGIEQRKGFIALTGEVGSGKTTICRALLKELDRERIRIALVLNPQLSDLELLQAINAEFGLEHTSDSKRELLDLLNRFLLDEFSKSHNCVLVIDESQRLSFEALEQVRLISNLELENTKLIQIALVGQPELDDMLHQPNLEQLNQRIMVRYHIDPLELEETRQYIEHRLHVASAETPAKFNNKAIKTLYEYSRGIPRKINVVADRALLVGFVEGKHEISGTMAQKAIEEVRGRRPSRKSATPVVVDDEYESGEEQPAAAATASPDEKESSGNSAKGLATAIVAGCFIIAIAIVMRTPGDNGYGSSEQTNQIAAGNNPPEPESKDNDQGELEQFVTDLADIPKNPTPLPEPEPTATPQPVEEAELPEESDLALVVPEPQRLIPEGGEVALQGNLPERLKQPDTNIVDVVAPELAVAVASDDRASTSPIPTPEPQPTPEPTPEITPTPTPGPTPPPPPAPEPTPTPEPEPEPIVAPAPVAEWSYDKQNILRVQKPEFSYAAGVLTWIARELGQRLPKAELEALRSMAPAQIVSYQLTTGEAPLYLRQATLPPAMAALRPELLPALAQVDRRARNYGPWTVVIGKSGGTVKLADPINGIVEVAESDFENSLASISVPYRDTHSITGLEPGDLGDSVTALQELLATANAYQGPATGVFDRQTEEAIRRFRENNNLPGTSAIDPLLALALIKQTTTRNESAPPQQ